MLIHAHVRTCFCADACTHLHTLSTLLHALAWHMHSAHRITALLWAAHNGNEAAVAALLKADGIDTNAKDKNG